MKMTKKALIASAMVILSSQVFAQSIQTTRVVKTADASTKAAAYNLAFNTLKTLEADSSIELNNDLGHVAIYSPTSVSLNDGAYITVAEKMDASGDMSYTGLVNVTVTFDVEG